MTRTFMRQEIEEIPAAAERMLKAIRPAAGDIARAMSDTAPQVMGTIARGSSDHAAHFLKYAFEIHTRIPVASFGPSLASIYGVVPRLDRSVVFGISQSGKSPDIVAMAKAAKKGGARTVAIVNVVPSPLAEASDHLVDIQAGVERSVAATKSFLCSALAGLAILAAFRPETELQAAIERFPDSLADALQCGWEAHLGEFAAARSAYVLGRGPSLAIAGEAALKFKETCGIHAEAYSAAEVMHGPVELAERGFPVIAFAGRDKAEAAVAETADAMAEKGARVFSTSPLSKTATILPLPAGGHPLLDALVQIVPCYLLLEELSRHRGRDPDRPERLKKVTETI